MIFIGILRILLMKSSKTGFFREKWIHLVYTVPEDPKQLQKKKSFISVKSF